MTKIEFSQSIEEVVQNVVNLHNLASGTESERKFHRTRVYNAEHLVVVKRPDGLIFAPVKWSGTSNNTPIKYDNRQHGVSTRYQDAVENLGLKIVREGNPDHEFYYGEFLEYCNRHNFNESPAGLPHSASGSRKFWILPGDVLSEQNSFPDEIQNPEKYFEGLTKASIVNAYERNAKARSACIAFHSPICQACSIDFGEVYGKLGEGFIHVHHKIPLHQINERYEVDPINDLVPVCPNCHAMIHRSKPMLTIEELARNIRRSAK